MTRLEQPSARIAVSPGSAGQSTSESTAPCAVDAVSTEMTTAPPISVLFVCLGNICRSPMAEAVFRFLTGSHHPQIARIDSCGTGAYHAGDSPDPRTMSTLEDNNILGYDHAARKVKHSDTTTFDYILAMDEENLDDLQRLRQRVLGKSGRGQDMGKVLLFGDYGGVRGEEVVDPYYGRGMGLKLHTSKWLGSPKVLSRKCWTGAEATFDGGLHAPNYPEAFGRRLSMHVCQGEETEIRVPVPRSALF